MTLTTLRTGIQYLTGDTGARFWTSAEILEVINEAQQQIAAELICLETPTVANYTGGTQEYDLPSNFYLAKGLWFRISTSADYKPLKYIDQDQLQAISGFDPNGTGTPEYWYIVYPGLNKLGVYPIYSDSVTAGFKLFMMKMPTALAAEGSTSDLPVFLQYLIKYYCCAKLYLKRRDLAMVNYFEGLYEKLLHKYKNKLDKRIGEVKDENTYWWL